MRSKLTHRLVSLIVAVSLLFSFSALFYASAAEQKGVITDVGTVGTKVRTGPSVDNSTSPPIKINGKNLLLYNGHSVTVLETVPSSNNDSNYPYWYKIKFIYGGKDYTGYVSTKYVKIINDGAVVLPDGVPKEYESYIKALLAAHTNWNFVFYDTKINWIDLFSEDAEGALGLSLIPYYNPISFRSTQDGAYNWREDKWIAQDSGQWYQANAQTIAHYMDPRNFLNEDNIFMFEQLSFNRATHNIDGVNAILKGTFMDNVRIKNNDGKDILYSEAYMDAADYSRVSPYHLASRTIQEVGKNGSNSVSGTRPGYEGYYNFYNIGAAQGSDPIKNGLEYAKKQGWNSQYKSILGGAKWIATGYIDKGQDTLYYQKFNTVNKVYWHQYMGNLMAPKHESVKIRDSYKELGILDNGYTFVIPYYRNMPSKPCELPASNNYSPNNWLKSLTVDGYSFSFDSAKTDGYFVSVPANVTSVKISAAPVNANAKISGAGTVSLKEGDNVFRITVTAQNGDKRTYTLNIKSLPKIPLTGIELSDKSVSLYTGDSKTLSVSYLPSTTTDDRTVAWTTSNPKVATVYNGKITAVGGGTAVITAKVGSFTRTCAVSVTDKGNVKVGDIDADGAVTIADALMVFKYKSGEINLSSTALKAADTDRNGKVELADALKIFKYKSGEIDTL